MYKSVNLHLINLTGGEMLRSTGTDRSRSSVSSLEFLTSSDTLLLHYGILLLLTLLSSPKLEQTSSQNQTFLFFQFLPCSLSLCSHSICLSPFLPPSLSLLPSPSFPLPPSLTIYSDDLSLLDTKGIFSKVCVPCMCAIAAEYK